MTAGRDYLALAKSSSREDFEVACPFPFLIGSGNLVKPPAPQRTMIGVSREALELTGFRAVPEALAGVELGKPAPLVLAVRKVQDIMPSMITVGRTANNDVVVQDVSVSKFHAYFRSQSEKVELCDAGSQNGTWIGEQRLVPKGPGGIVVPGALVRFANVAFTFVTAGDCWDRLR